LRVMRRHAPYRRADGPALIQPMVGGLLRRPALLLGAACVLLVLGFQLWITPTNPPGFIRDEASFSYNAYTIGHSLRAQDGGLLPLCVACVLLATEWAYRSDGLARGAPVGLALGAVMYCYAAGRLLAPLFAVGLLVFGRRRWLLSAWGVFALTLVPLIAYWFRHPGALTARYQATTFIHGGMSFWTIVRKTASHYVHDWNLWHWT